MKLKCAILALALLLAGCARQQQRISYIGAGSARELALEAAGVAAADAAFSGTDMGSRNGLDYYEVRFTSGGTNYAYRVDALSGLIIEGGPAPAETARPAASPPSRPASTPAPTPEPAAAPEPQRGPGSMTPEQAKELALSLVPGAAMADIREFETDYDDGRLEYEGKVIYGEMEYEFEIDGYSGSIRSWDVESIYD